MIPNTLSILGLWVVCLSSLAAERGTISAVNDPKNILPTTDAAAVAASARGSTNRGAATAQGDVARATQAITDQTRTSLSQQNSGGARLLNQSDKAMAARKAANSRRQRDPIVTPNMASDAKGPVQAAAQQARSEALANQIRAEELREQVRANLRENTTRPPQIPRAEDTKNRADELKTKLVEHKELLDQASRNSKDRSRRGID